MMSTAPNYRVFTKRKLQDDPKPNKTKRLKRLEYRTFREPELKLLDEVLHDNNIELEGNICN